MSINAGQILHIGGNAVIDRIQSAGLGNVRVPTDIIREVGNPAVVDKVVTEPDFTFTLESFDVSTELEAFLCGKVAANQASAAAIDQTASDGTEYRLEDWQSLNVPSPWKDGVGAGSAGTINAGHLVPGYYPTKISYKFGVTENASQTVELAGSSYYYADAAPIEDFDAGTGAQVAFATAHPAVGYRKGGAAGSSFKRVFGVIVDGVIAIPDVDYVETGPADASASTATITFTTAPANGAVVRFAYFTTTPQGYPPATHASTVTKPGAVRGRNICVYLGSGSTRTKLGGVQSATLDASITGVPTREFCNEEIIGRTIEGYDTNGDVVVRVKDKDALMTVLAKITGVAKTEVIGYLNIWPLPLEIAIQNPKNPAQILKTLYVGDALFQVPGTESRVNQPTDFTLHYEGRAGVYSAFKGAKP